MGRLLIVSPNAHDKHTRTDARFPASPLNAEAPAGKSGEGISCACDAADVRKPCRTPPPPGADADSTRSAALGVDASAACAARMSEAVITSRLAAEASRAAATATRRNRTSSSGRNSAAASTVNRACVGVDVVTEGGRRADGRPNVTCAMLGGRCEGGRSDRRARGRAAGDLVRKASTGLPRSSNVSTSTARIKWHQLAGAALQQPRWRGCSPSRHGATVTPPSSASHRYWRHGMWAAQPRSSLAVAPLPPRRTCPHDQEHGHMRL